MSRQAFVGVDWGTSSFRAWLFDSVGEVLRNDKTNLGLAHLGPTDFAPALSDSLKRLNAEPGLPIVACGMVGAAQGWQEAAYAQTGEDLRTLPERAVQPQPNVWILPGIKQVSDRAPDVMRGEETLVLGLLGKGLEETTLCLPGTHSKWITVEQGSVGQFRTFMTGEVFGLMQDQSVLRAYTSESAVDPNGPAFRQGVEQSLEYPEGLLNALFTCRSTPLVFGTHAAKNMASRLSGLLVGAEIAGARASGLAASGTVQLIADQKLGPLYETAFSIAGVAYQIQDAERLAQQGLLFAARQLWPDRLKERSQ